MARDVAKLRTQKQRGDEAKRLMEHPLMQEAFEAVEKTIEQGWKNTGGQDAEARENAYKVYRIFRKFRSEFEGIMKRGGDASVLLDRIE